MVGAVVMAGGESKRNLVEVVRDVIAYLPMKFAESIGGYSFEVPIRGYKHAKKVEGSIGGIVEKRPVIIYVVHRLCNASNIDEISIVGEKKILESILEKNMPSGSYKRFKNIGKIVQHTGYLKDFKENALRGYNNLSKNILDSTKGYVLFIYGDSINSTSYGIDKFIEGSKEVDADIILGVATQKQLDTFKKYFRRPPLKLIDDIGFSEADRDEDGRVGLRSADRIYANPTRVKNLDAVDDIYKFRRIAKILMHPFKSRELKRRLGINLTKYLARKLKLSEVLEKASNELLARVSILKVEDAACSLDLDAERDIYASERMNHDLMTGGKREMRRIKLF